MTQSIDDNRPFNFKLDTHRQFVHTPKGAVYLRSKLWTLFICLLHHKNRLVSREQLIEEVWDGNQLTGDYGLTHGICKLRQMIKSFDLNITIATIAKSGYLLSSPECHRLNYDHRNVVSI